MEVALDAETCWSALRARDPRFDGVFFVGVETTGIYCRPVCPARTPGRHRCRFFARAAEAERAGFRACFRCRPELAPGVAPVDAIPKLVSEAMARIDAGVLDEASVDSLAESLGVTARHLRRAMEAELGISPRELAQTRRLATAKQLLQDTSLPLTQIAFASGFASVRRFNTAFRQRFGGPPSSFRRGRERAGQPGMVELRLDYRPPLDWIALLDFVAPRAIPGVESVEDETYRRTLAIDSATGWMEVTAAPKGSALRVRLSSCLVPHVRDVVRRLRRLFDLDAEPQTIAASLGQDARLAASVRDCPGLRLPGAFDPFEVAVRAILGQQVSVKGATTLCGRLVEAFGGVISGGAPDLDRSFPGAAVLAAVSPEAVQGIGLPAQRARTIVELAREVADGRLDLEARGDPERAIAQLLAVHGIGPWTAHYLAMRVLHWPDAFVAGDLGIKKALGESNRRVLETRAQAWRPWRAYAVMHLWRSLGGPR